MSEESTGNQESRTENPESTGFNELAKEQRSSLLFEFWLFLKYNKKWWLLPILIVLLLLGALVLLGGTAIAPFIYPLF
jgi:hypothetical protein